MVAGNRVEGDDEDAEDGGTVGWQQCLEGIFCADSKANGKRSSSAGVGADGNDANNEEENKEDAATMEKAYKRIRLMLDLAVA